MKRSTRMWGVEDMPDLKHWRRNRFWLTTLAAALIVLMSSAVAAQPVTVASIDGVLEFRHDTTQPWQQASTGATLPVPVEFRTGADTSARVSQSGTSFDISAETRVTLTNENDSPDGLITRVKQWLGTVFYDVERQPDTFSVETAFLVATVKGTEFTIVATDASSFVTLDEGRLEVVNLKSGDVQILEPGDIAGVNDEQAGIDSLQQAPDALSEVQQQLALELASEDINLDLGDYSAEDLLNTLNDQLQTQLAMNIDADLISGLQANLGVNLGDGIGSSVVVGVGDDLGVTIGADVGSDLGIDIDADLGGDLGVDIGADIGDDLIVDVGADLGDDLGVDLGVGDDLGVDLGVDLGGDLGLDIRDGLGDDLDVDLGLGPW